MAAKRMAKVAKAAKEKSRKMAENQRQKAIARNGGETSGGEESGIGENIKSKI